MAVCLRPTNCPEQNLRGKQTPTGDVGVNKPAWPALQALALRKWAKQIQMRTASRLLLVVYFSVCGIDALRAQWIQTNGPGPGGVLWSLATDGTHLYVGNNEGYGGVYRSTDHGIHWQHVYSGPNNLVQALVAHGPYVFAGSYPNYVNNGGVIVSTDHGTTWRVGGLSTTLSVRALAILDTVLIASIYAPTPGEMSLVRSTDYGTTWSTVYSGVDVGVLITSGHDFLAGRGGVLRSSDYGTSWTLLNTGLPREGVTGLVARDSILVASYLSEVYLSTNSGASWKPAGLNGYGVQSLAFEGDNIIAGTRGNGVYSTSDLGTTWVPINTGLINRWVYALLSFDSLLYAGTSSGIYLSVNHGRDWLPTGLPRAYVNSLFQIGTDILAGTNGIYRSTDNGDYWIPVDGPWHTGAPFTAFALFDSTIFAAGESIFSSTDNGTNWSPAGSTAIRNVTSLAVIAGSLFVGTIPDQRLGGGGVFLSTNKGITWTETTANLSHNVNSLLVDGSFILAGTGDHGVYMTGNNAGSWTAANDGLTNPNVRSLILVRMNLYAGTADGVFRSTNHGTSWVRVSSGLSNTNVVAVYAYDTNLIAGTSNGGVFTSPDSGAHWIPVNEQMGNFIVSSFVAYGGVVLAGTLGGGVWKRPITEIITSAPQNPSYVPSVFSLNQNYPNPFNPSTTISYSLPKNANVSLRIFNTLGQEIASLVNERQEVGYYQATWNATVPSGIYFYRLQAREILETKKMILLR